MKHSNIGETLRKLRTVLTEAPLADADAHDKLNGATFLEQEPDLRKEAGEHTRQASGWAAGGHPTGE